MAFEKVIMALSTIGRESPAESSDTILNLRSSTLSVRSFALTPSRPL